MGGGNFVTQAYPTNFHTFHTRKVLVGDEKPGDFKEVTAAERAAIEAQDAKWEEWPQWLIDAFDHDRYGRYNPDTGFGELNGLTDISLADAINIHAWGNKLSEKGFSASATLRDMQIRTNMSPLNTTASNEMNVAGLFQQQQIMETCRITGSDDEWTSLTHIIGRYLGYIFDNCKKLRKVHGILNLEYYTAGENIFRGCVSLEDIRIKGLKASLNMSPCKSISSASLAWLVARSAATSPISVKVHPDIFAKLTDENNTEWHQLALDAAAKNIQFITI